MTSSIEHLARRRFIQLGGTGSLGLSLAGLMNAQAATAVRTGVSPIRACILLFYYGAQVISIPTI